MNFKELENNEKIEENYKRVNNLIKVISREIYFDVNLKKCFKELEEKNHNKFQDMVNFFEYVRQKRTRAIK